MEDWTGWAAALFGFLLTILGINYRMDKKRNEDSAKECALRDAVLAERLTRVETELMTEREVRQVLKDYFDPFMINMSDMQKDVQHIKIHLARLPRRREDKGV